MKIKVLGSSSRGNCYLLQLENETLILECGVSYKEILKGLDFNLKSVVGCLVTHEHKDHSKSLVELTNNGIDVYSSKGTLEALKIENHRTKIIKSEELFKIGNFKIMPFSTKHDAIEPLGFLINHKEIGNLLFITDTYYCEYNFNNLNHIMIECNYSKDLLDNNKDKIYLRNRIVKSHFELNNVINFLKANDLSNTKTITLLHLSEDNSDKNLFIREIEKNIGIPVVVAEKGLEIYLD
ncbi:TPA: MBL fold metallo-hydrolase [Clostridioides difficile]|uniref:MBL fold metallo-hydrolase n=1 Tax=Clostridioides difficile TaxID=1496 RepID=UPI00098A61D0|nr:MBL fold metallo-hydrolase [Clostridioides difficile]EGT4022617.1 MBL fold metallo-hydrolase [Clostridioides difficile]EJA6614132.1 MBL fold metallo-hydrolase [Clostridioides difficile]MBU5298363.1 MBL fold metallo-hydrolase [Clostridioides difficile]MBY2041876.1 MBL fold metallo-hydrolase [Clostridioides difficile]MCI2340980.1 MBL fold metallo-hydrolase [Clostridioides difficile]